MSMSQMDQTFAIRKVYFLCVLGGCAILVLWLTNGHLNISRNIFLGIDVNIDDVDDSSRDNELLVLDANESVVIATKWIVVTSIQRLTKDVEFLASIRDWHLLVVGDKKSPKDFACPNKNCTFLNVEQQERLGYTILRHLTYNCYCRKIVGYLYAIQHGAQLIYDTDDDNRPIGQSLDQLFNTDSFTAGLVYNPQLRTTTSNYDVVNPLAHFGQPNMWPRGFPLNRVLERNSQNYTACGRMRVPLIQQGMIEFDPDVDAIYRLTHEEFLYAKPNVSFDRLTPPFIVPPFVFTPTNTQNTLFHYDALWSLVLPVSVAFRVTDIWRGYWAQRLLWLIGGQVGFYPSTAIQIRNLHSYLNDFRQEIQLYNQSDAFCAYLASWRCRSTVFFKCVQQLSYDMVAQQFWGIKDANLVDAWLIDLRNIGYKFPKIVNDHQLCLTEAKDVLFVPVSLPKSVGATPSQAIFALQQICKASNVTQYPRLVPSKNIASRGFYYKTVLVITFNYPGMYTIIPVLHAMYSPFFQKIVYCGVDDGKFTSDQLAAKIFIKLSQKDMMNGDRHYYCTAKAAQLDFRNIDGYLSISDDVLMNPWYALNVTVPNSYLDCYEDEAKFVNVGMPAAVRKILAAFKYILANKASWSYEAVRRILRLDRNYTEDAGLAMLAKNWKCYADITYIPASQAKLFAQVAPLFKENDIFLEYAMPKLLWGLGWEYYSNTSNRVGEIPGEYLWYDGKRGHPMDYFNASKMFVHPVKLKTALSNVAMKRQLCDKFVSELMQYIV